MGVRGVVLLLLGLLSGVTMGQALEPPRFVEGPCPFLLWEPEIEGETIVCGTLDVPESRTGLSDNVVTLQVAVLKARTTTPVTPIIYLEGGPGGSALAGIYHWLESTLRQYADVILFDQRGTGYSLPSLDCPEFHDPDLPADADVEELCHRRLVAEGVALGAYTSAETAADIDALIRALGLPEATLFGVSYGTRAALTAVRDYPERIRSIVLDSPYPPNVDGYNEQVINGARAFEVLFADCEASRVCRSAYPNLRETFLDMIDDLNRDPMIGTDEFGEEVQLDGDTVVNELFSLFYSTTALPYLPAIITAAANRDYDAYVTLSQARDDDIAIHLETMTDEEFDAYVARFLSFETVEAYLAFRETLSTEAYLDLLDELYRQQETDQSPEEQAALDQRLLELTGLGSIDELNDYLRNLSDDEYYALIHEAYGAIDDDSEGTFNSVECFEEVPFNSTRIAERLAEPLPDNLAAALFLGVEQQFVSCQIWDIEPAGEIETQPVVSDVPALVLSGEYDPITPPAWGQAAANYLANSQFFVFPGMGHGLIDVPGRPCPTDILTQFLLDPDAPVDASCVARMGAPDFYVE